MALEEIFNTKSKSRIIHLQNQLRSFRKEELSIDDYITRLTAMAKELWEAETTIDGGELSLFSLNGLDTSYDPFLTAQTTRVDDIIFASLLGLLCSYES